MLNSNNKLPKSQWPTTTSCLNNFWKWILRWLIWLINRMVRRRDITPALKPLTKIVISKILPTIKILDNRNWIRRQICCGERQQKLKKSPLVVSYTNRNLNLQLKIKSRVRHNKIFRRILKQMAINKFHQ